MRFLLAIACALRVQMATAQELSGTLIGTVEDAQGGFSTVFSTVRSFASARRR